MVEEATSNALETEIVWFCMAAPKGHKRYGGRAKGSPNKATADARAAIALFVDRNAHRLQGWLDGIAEGIEGPPEKDEEGNETKTYLVDPNPQKAFELFQSVIEYHVPKLARTELAAPSDGKGPPVLRVEFVPPVKPSG